MKLAIVFEVPDDDADEMYRTGVQITELYDQARRRRADMGMPDFWQFPGKMAPVAVAMAGTDEGLVGELEARLSPGS